MTAQTLSPDAGPILHDMAHASLNASLNTSPGAPLHDSRRDAHLTLHAARLRLGTQAFGPFDVTVRAGERVAILGPSGAGKSTLLRLMSRELRPQEGEVSLDGQALPRWSLPTLSQRRAVLPQSHEVAFGLPVELVIGLGRVTRSHDPQLAHIVRQAAEQARAAHLLGQRFDTLSGGEKARVQLARVFAQLWDAQHGWLMVDEPLAALDPGLQFELMAAIGDFAAARGHAVIAVLHDIQQALQAFDRLLLVRQGQLVGDLPATLDAADALAALYGIELVRAVDAEGTVLLTPRRLPRGSGMSLA